MRIIVQITKFVIHVLDLWSASYRKRYSRASPPPYPWVLTHGLNRPWMENIHKQKIPLSSKKAKLEFAMFYNYLHSIYITFTLLTQHLHCIRYYK